MKKLICILAGAALLTGCGQKSEVAAPTPAPEKKVDTSAMGQRPKKKLEAGTTLSSSMVDEKKLEADAAAQPPIPSEQAAKMEASPTP